MPKPDGKLRPIIDLRHLNKFILYIYFKQETFNTVLDIIQKSDYFCKIDLLDAYYTVSIDPSCNKFWKFYW